MRYVITGGAGFTARHLTEALVARGDEVVLFDLREPALLPSGTRFVRGDVRDPAQFAGLGLGPDDVVFHLAARQFADGVPAHGRDEWFAEVNVAGTKNVLDAMAKGGATRLVFFSTDMVYGIPQRSPVPNDHPLQPLGPYGRSKQAAEALMNARRAQGFRITAFRPRLITGPGRFGILVKLFKLIRAGLPVPLIGRGVNRYQMASVRDCVAAALHAVEAGCPAGPYNLGSIDPPTVRELLAAVIARAGSSSRLIPTPAGAVKLTLSALDRAGLTLLYPEQYLIADADYVLDLSATERDLGWRPRDSDIDMLTAAYQQFVERGEA